MTEVQFTDKWGTLHFRLGPHLCSCGRLWALPHAGKVDSR